MSEFQVKIIYDKWNDKELFYEKLEEFIKKARQMHNDKYNYDLVEYINNLTKKIYDTDFFSDVKISYNQDVLTITVVENPIVNFFYINGIKDSDLDQVNKIITLKENSIFSSSKLKKDIEANKNIQSSEPKNTNFDTLNQSSPENDLPF